MFFIQKYLFIYSKKPPKLVICLWLFTTFSQFHEVQGQTGVFLVHNSLSVLYTYHNHWDQSDHIFVPRSVPVWYPPAELHHGMWWTDCEYGHLDCQGGRPTHQYMLCVWPAMTLPPSHSQFHSLKCTTLYQITAFHIICYNAQSSKYDNFLLGN